MNETTAPYVYHIRIEGRLDLHWSSWFDGMEIILLENDETLISGPVVDQTALHGILAKIRDMNLKLVSVSKV